MEEKSEEMIGLRTEEGYAQEIRELMTRKNIKKTDDYLRYLEEQKRIKRDKAVERVRKAEWELNVIKKMRKGIL
ncbi:MAG: hypothetical protein N2V72_00415 [Methanophagales archaeon]|nr:hypothetical protein [Methanophagales archaeon]